LRQSEHNPLTQGNCQSSTFFAKRFPGVIE
jgi:hypothetical protein